jgi:hypothetical protein
MKFGCDTIEISCNFLTPAHSTSSVSNLQAITRDEDDEHRRVYLLCPFSSGRVSQLHTQLTYLTHYPRNLILIYAAPSMGALPGTGRFIWLVICLIAESASRMCARTTSYSCDLCREQGLPLLLLCIWKDWHGRRTLFSPFLTSLCARHPFFSRWPFRERTHSYGHMSYCCAFTSHCPFISPYFSGRSLCYNLANSARLSREMRLMGCEVNKRSSKILISTNVGFSSYENCKTLLLLFMLLLLAYICQIEWEVEEEKEVTSMSCEIHQQMQFSCERWKNLLWIWWRRLLIIFIVNATYKSHQSIHLICYYYPQLQSLSCWWDVCNKFLRETRCFMTVCCS